MMAEWLLPAYAGMVPTTTARCGWCAAAPRVRGDGPCSAAVMRACAACSPRTRGWSRAGVVEAGQPRLLPAAGSGRGCSPRTRGWSAPLREGGQQAPLLPAYAGMVRLDQIGHDPGLPAPRVRGDGPPLKDQCEDPICCSPRTRGWSRVTK